MANAVVVENFKQYCDSETMCLLNSNYDIDNLEDWLIKKAEKEAIKGVKGYGKEHVSRLLIGLDKKESRKKIKDLQDIYFIKKKNNLSTPRNIMFNERHVLLERQLKDNICDIVKMLKRNTAVIGDVSDKIKTVLNIDNKFNTANSEIPDFSSMIGINDIKSDDLNILADDGINQILNDCVMRDALNKLRYVYINLLSNYDFIHKNNCIVDYLKLLRDNAIKFTSKPSNFNEKKYIKDNVDKLIAEL
jgi:hypothetical protein